nr:RNA-directed DNA polymerase, eukaryota [Tanacetum cinerariifolium]
MLKKRIGNGADTSFWSECWLGDIPLRAKYPRLFTLEMDKEALVESKLHSLMESSFRRNARGGIEQHLLVELTSMLESVSLLNSCDRWICDLTSDGDVRVKEVNVFTWRARQDCLPTRVNLVRRGINVESCVCQVCSSGEEDINHTLFRCDLAQQVLRRICRWWDLDPSGWSSFQEWYSWFLSIRLSSKVKSLLKGTFFVAWWSIWRFKNHTIFEEIRPRRSE